MSVASPASRRWSGAPWRSVSTWLSRAPVDDPVDRRNAPMLQILLLLLALTPPLMWLYRAVAVDTPWRPGETTSLAISLAISLFALLDLWMIRRGRFQAAVRLLMAVIAIAMLLAYLGSGFGANRFEQPIQAVWLIVAGLVIGRRALWLMYGWMVLAFVAGTFVDIGSEHVPDTAMILVVDCAIAALIFLFIAIVVDRTVAALRESLHVATVRGDELARANERLQAEIAERERVREQLVHAQKMDAVGRLAAGVAHDFNHLLGLVAGHAARGQRAQADPDAMRQALAGVESAARRANAVSRKLLNFSRLDAATPETFDGGQALRDMQATLRQLFDPAVAIRMEVPDLPQPILFDRAQFDLVILNIAANASDAMPAGGTFGVALCTDDPAGRIAIELRDSGQGMAPDVQARIFEPFFTTKPPGQGTGLGLAVVRDLVAEAGGEIRVDSSTGSGTTVRIELPAAAPAQA